jgi:hypothetical protein
VTAGKFFDKELSFVKQKLGSKNVKRKQFSNSYDVIANDKRRGLDVKRE